MKKKLIAILALATIAACNKADVVESNPGEAIAFDDAFVGNATKATDPSYGTHNSLTSFNVWGTVSSTTDAPVAIFANDPVTGTVGENSVWSCTSKTQYWIADAKYNFAALVDAGNVTLGADLLPAKVAFESNGSTDLLYAKSEEYTGKVSGNDLVAFGFAHLLSKIYLKVTNNSTGAAGYSFLMKDIKINGLKTAATYYIQADGEHAAGTWTATAGDYTFDNITVAAGAASAECDAEQLIIPGAITVSFNLDILYNGSTLSTKPYTYSTSIEAGKAYRINVTASVGEEIKFTVSENPSWDTTEPEISL